MGEWEPQSSLKAKAVIKLIKPFKFFYKDKLCCKKEKAGWILILGGVCVC